MGAYSVVTPFRIPAGREKKRANAGDDLILQGVRRLLRTHRCRHLVGSWRLPSEQDIRRINSTRALILACANALDDRFSVFPGATAEFLSRIRVPIVPFGMGINGHPDKNQVMSGPTCEILKLIHGRTRLSSWRCRLTLNYLKTQMPELEPSLVLTGCPSMYHDFLLSGRPFSNRRETVVVTITDRGDFWDRETAVIDAVRRFFPDSEKILCLHQDFAERQDRSAEIRRYARDRGYRIRIARSAGDCESLYKRCDFHIGSRLHAHLHFLARCKESYLVPVDDRAGGFAQTFGFPLYDPRGPFPEYDFEKYRQSAIKCFDSMKRFTSYLEGSVLGRGGLWEKGLASIRRDGAALAVKKTVGFLSHRLSLALYPAAAILRRSGIAVLRRRSDPLLRRLIQGRDILILGSGPSAAELGPIGPKTLVFTCNRGLKFFSAKPLGRPVDLYMCTAGKMQRMPEIVEGLARQGTRFLLVDDPAYILKQKSLAGSYEYLVRDDGKHGEYLQALIRPLGARDIQGRAFHPWTSTGIRLLQLALYFGARRIILAGVDFGADGYFWGRNDERWLHDEIDENFLRTVSERSKNIFSASAHSPAARLLPPQAP